MKISTKSLVNYFIPVLFGLVLSYGYYLDAKGVTITSTSSDQWNILPVCIKLDHTSLYEDDLFAHNAHDVKYYTPFFVDSVRGLTRLSAGNYVEGLNKLNFIINAIFSISWYIFFLRLLKNMPLALLMSLVVRGVLWMPGFELWGAGALWIALPRTAYVALLPLVLLMFNPFVSSVRLRYLGALVCGIIANFHPVSGLGMGISLVSSIFVYELYGREKPVKIVFQQALVGGLLVLVGLLPFIFTYWEYVLGVKASDPELFNSMIPLRIGDQFRNPLVDVKKFGQWRWVVMIWAPVLAMLVVRGKLSPEKRSLVCFYGIFLVAVLAFSLLIVPVELLLRSAGLDIHMAFQLVRNAKYIIVPVFVCCALLLGFALSLVRGPWRRRVSYLLLGLLVLAMQVSRFTPFNRLPLIGDDCIRATLPNVLSIRSENLYGDVNLDEMFFWINNNLPTNAKFIGPAQLRTACRRSVVFDGKGASMVIEGNPDRFVEWGERALALKECSGCDERTKLYRAWGAEYVLVEEELSGQNLLYSQGGWCLYALQVK